MFNGHVQRVADQYRLFRKLLNLPERDLMICDLRYGWPIARLHSQAYTAGVLHATEWRVRQAETRMQEQLQGYPAYPVFVAGNIYNPEALEIFQDWQSPHYRFLASPFEIGVPRDPRQTAESIRKQVRQTTHTVILVNDNDEMGDPDAWRIGARNWMEFMVRESWLNHNAIAAVKAEPHVVIPKILKEVALVWAHRFTKTAVLTALGVAGAVVTKAKKLAALIRKCWNQLLEEIRGFANLIQESEAILEPSQEVIPTNPSNRL